MPVLRGIDVRLSGDDLRVLARLAGPGRGQTVRTGGVARAEEPTRPEEGVRAVAEEARRLAAPAAVYERFPLRAAREAAVEVGGKRLSGRALAHATRGATEAAVIVATIGPRLEEEVSARTAAGRVCEAFALDAAGSLLVERLVTTVCARVESEAAAAGLRTGPPLGPGHADWPVSEQARLFDLLRPETSIGVRLTGGGLMVPVKSASVLVGVGRKLAFAGGSRCDACTLAAGCRYRRSGGSVERPPGGPPGDPGGPPERPGRGDQGSGRAARLAKEKGER